MQQDYTLGIEEEYLLVDRDSFDLAEAPEALMEACKAELENQVSPEFLQCQIEVGTRVCATIDQARDDLRRLRDCVSRHAAKHNLSPIAVS
jgi:carboxylate-amine ligase